MLKKEITYIDFNDQEVTETFYFNLTKSEIVELETTYEGGLETVIKNIIATKDNNKLLQEFKRIVLMAYGEKSEDGRRFIKSGQMREEFSQTAAYDALFMEIATDENAAVDFINGVIPKGLTESSGRPMDPKPASPPLVQQPDNSLPLPASPTSPGNSGVVPVPKSNK